MVTLPICAAHTRQVASGQGGSPALPKTQFVHTRCLQAYAESTYGVLLTITSMSACDSILPAEAPTPAPAPVVARRMLAA